MKQKQPARNLNIRKRFLAITKEERIRAEFWKKLALIFLLKSRAVLLQSRTNVAYAEEFKNRARIAFLRYIQIAYEPDDFKLEPPQRLVINISVFDESFCMKYFKFKKTDLFRLLNGLRFSKKCHLENRSTLPGEEVLLRGIYQMVNGTKQFDMAEGVFGRDQSQQSRAFKYFIDYVYDNFAHLVNDNLDWWHRNGYIAASQRAIESRLQNLGLDVDNAGISGAAYFLGCNSVDYHRTGASPRDCTSNSSLLEDEAQLPFLNRGKSIHGWKFQALDIAHGFTIDFYGSPILSRNQDSLLVESELERRLELTWEQHTRTHRVLGRRNHHSTQSANIVDTYKNSDPLISELGCEVEWNFGAMISFFGLLQNSSRLRVMSEGTVTKIFYVAAILRNCHIALYGNCSSRCFNISLDEDMLEKYLQKS